MNYFLNSEICLMAAIGWACMTGPGRGQMEVPSPTAIGISPLQAQVQQLHVLH